MRARLLQICVLVFAVSLSPHAARATRARGAATAATPQAAEILFAQVKRAVVVVNAYDVRGRVQSQGSGFFVRPDRIVTNLHVVGRASRVEVLTFDGRRHTIEGLVALSQGRDLALMQTPENCPAVSFLPMDDTAPREGEEIFVVGNPQGHSWQVSRGRTLAVWDSQDVGALVRISASISRGSSGSPVVNMRGHVVGIATLSLKGGEESFFAVPAAEVSSLRPQSLMTFPLRPSE